MNEEENGRDANELHSFGGMKDESPNETKTENEELADAIEELESNEVDESIPDAPKDINEEPKPTMTIDSIDEPKAKKGGAGWKVATILFAVLAVFGCGAACYLFFADGTTKFLGREVSSKSETVKTPAVPGTPDSTKVAGEETGRYIYLDGTGLALKIPETLDNLSYEYHIDNEGSYGGENHTWKTNFSTLAVSATLRNEDAQSRPAFIRQYNDNIVALGNLTIAGSKPESDIIGEPTLTFKTDDGFDLYIYYEGPQTGTCIEELAACSDWENKSVGEIKKWLTNKDNYVKVK